MNKKALTALAVIFVAVNVVDIAATYGIVERGGYEANPVMAKVISGGWLQAVALKVVAPAAIAGVLWRLRRKAMLAVLDVGFAGIATWNILGLIL